MGKRDRPSNGNILILIRESQEYKRRRNTWNNFLGEYSCCTNGMDAQNVGNAKNQYCDSRKRRQP